MSVRAKLDAPRQAAPLPLTESELAYIWAGQRLPDPALRTLTGQPVRVVHPGRENHGAGPDFRDAVVEIGGRRQRGDIELHLRSSSFRTHGHAADPAYGRVVLHVVYLDDDDAETLLPGGGVTVPVVALSRWLTRRAAEIARWLEAPAAWREPCRDADQRLGATEVARVLDTAGRGRFAAKVAALAAAKLQLGPDAALWQALFDIAGVGGDREGYRRLVERCSPSEARSVIEGLSRAEAVITLSWRLIHDATALGLGRGARPANRPERRLAALAQLFVRAGGDLPAYARATVAAAKDGERLVAAWQVGGGSGPALLGRERAQELVVNAVLPFVASEPEMEARAMELLAALKPRSRYGKTAFLESHLGREGKVRRAGSVLEQQGMLALLSDWCSQDGCGRCPLSMGM